MSTPHAVARARQHSLGDIPRRSARRNGPKTAIVNGDTRLSFTELDAVVDRTAAAIDAAGLVKGDRLALLSHNCWQFAVLSFATARRGVVLVPVNFMLNPEEIAYVLDHSGAVAFVAEDGLTDTAEKAIAASAGAVTRRLFIPLDTGAPQPGWTDVTTWLEHDGPLPDDVLVADDDPVRLMYTSGTESRPKGAILTGRALLWQYASCAIDGEMTGDDIEVHALPLYHCAQLDCFLNVDVYTGATSIILPAPQPAAILSAIAEHGATKLFAPPTVWIALLRSPEFDTTDLSTLRKGYYGASPMPVEILHELRGRLPQVRFWNFYGQTEMAPLATILRPDEQLPRAGSAGRPAINVETIVVDDNDEPVPPGTVGEIVHRSPHATLGYYRDEEKTAEAFRNGWFHSGDLGILDEDGYLRVVDRKKDMIKTGGENVASREVEEALYQHPGIAEVAVFGIDHPHWIEAVTAVVVPKEPGLDPDEVVSFSKSVLAGFKAPKYVVVADALPKNPSGKILKRELRQRYGHLGQG
ncbi:acyl-CoA synthetase [Cryptosporangium aurantiacum]|uniref:Fatty-acyl-CoA synthase n=1 Tax=Cryptosporangium aurantiacum TaxID=134849 RepID=A0A1M7KE94_9ACTN|nr:acyl-CoA synthetase [Cryptosporangium aurantiacum]SHM63659.1 fatty-acyl-CoA synthase [Cryptosporangium aurantiacum]